MTFCTVTPDRGDRKPFMDFCKYQLSRMITKPAKSYFIEHPPADDRKDLIPRIKMGIEMAKKDGFDKVYIIESDDWYPPYYFDIMQLNGSDFVGCDRTIYYNISNRTYEYLHHPNHSSLCFTGFKISALDSFQWPENQAIFLDLKLWRHAKRQNKKVTLHQEAIGIGIKHGIGLTGGSGHRRILKHIDPTLEFLHKQLYHKDKTAFEFYVNFVTSSK